LPRNPLYRPGRHPELHCHLSHAHIALLLGGTDASFGLRRKPGRPIGLPLRVPLAAALDMPANTRSRIMDRSNSAKTPIIWNMALPDGVDVSIPSAAPFIKASRPGRASRPLATEMPLSSKTRTTVHLSRW
jgi:hypothetical protein